VTSLEIVLTAEVAEAFPETQIRLVVADGLRTGPDWPHVGAAIQSLESRLAGQQWQPATEEDDEIASWHAAYRRFGANPRRLRPSVDALCRRLARTGRLPRVSPPVDAYNLVSVRYGIPAGAFDLERLHAPVHIRRSRPGDRFTPLGEPDTVEEPAAHEVVYASGERVLTRCWNHRDCDETKLTEESTTAVFLLERVSSTAVSDDRMQQAQQALAGLVTPHADLVSFATIDATRPVARLAPVP
jgi:DNA/RNA-binding domain of Phe-tRNA-synthetase-like protein